MRQSKLQKSRNRTKEAVQYIQIPNQLFPHVLCFLLPCVQVEGIHAVNSHLLQLVHLRFHLSQCIASPRAGLIRRLALSEFALDFVHLVLQLCKLKSVAREFLHGVRRSHRQVTVGRRARGRDLRHFFFLSVFTL